MLIGHPDLSYNDRPLLNKGLGFRTLILRMMVRIKHHEIVLVVIL